MNTILLEPTDVLFFRDGRPMGGASSGHGAAWPSPAMINHAFHAALHRAGEPIKQQAHVHRRGRNGQYSEQRDRRFGSLVTAGPFPVETKFPAESENGATTWYFPRPMDADDSFKPSLFPLNDRVPQARGSLPAPCRHPVVSSRPPSKDKPKPWWSERAWNQYLGSEPRPGECEAAKGKRDADFSTTEHSIGIEIHPQSGTVAKKQFYSAHYLRLHDGFRLGVFAEAPDKGSEGNGATDLLRLLLTDAPTQINAGGQQRVCTAIRRNTEGRLPLPLGLSPNSYHERDGKFLVKWVLLSPAIWPAMEGENLNAHPGGWLPNWICPSTGKVLLKAGDTQRRPAEGREAWRRRVRQMESPAANLVAAIVDKPQVVTGYAGAMSSKDQSTEVGPKATLLAVPAGAVYYFEAHSAQDALALANALNWHGASPGTEILNRRSTLMGEKGFGLGVCGTWNFLRT